ncbi:hypothetical protein JCM11491_000732 [Sporobolomyces phaffii]
MADAPDSAPPAAGPSDGANSAPAEPVPTPVDPISTSDAAPPMTKSALKRQRRQELYESQKIARRAREKEKKKTKQAEKRKLIEEGVLDRPEPKKRKKGGEADGGEGKKVEYGARIVLDVAFDHLMHDKEVKSMTSQVAYCYAANRNATQPFPILVSALSGRLKEAYDKRKDHLNWKGVEWWEEGFEKLYEARDSAPAAAAESEGTETATATATTSTGTAEEEKVKLGVYAGRPRSTAPKSSIIYLTGDSPNVLSSIEPDHTYILGGIVDRNRHKLLCLNKANELGIQHAQLPIGQYLPEMSTRKVLTVNQVFEIMVNWVESVREKKEQLRAEGKSEDEIAKAEGDWREALRKVMPVRKFDKDGKAKKRAEKRAEKKQSSGQEGVYVVEVDDDSDDFEGQDDDDDDDDDDGNNEAGEQSLPDPAPTAAEEVEGKEADIRA